MSVLAESDRKTFVHVATTGNIPLADVQTIDGVLVSVGDSVLVKNQSNPVENGVYFVKAGPYVRAPMKAGSLILVEKGTAHKDSLWTISTDLPLSLDESVITFSELTNTDLVANIPSEAFLSVANLAALSALSLTNLVSGMKVYVVSLDANFTLSLTSSAALNSLTVVATSGLGRWLRQIEPSLKWALQLTWYVSPATGNDENSGQSGSPIKTLAELARRLIGVIPADYNVNLMDDVPSTDSWDYNPKVLAAGSAFAGTSPQLIITGVSTPAVSGTVVAAVGATPASNIPCSLQDASTSWASHLGKVVKMTSGALSGRVAVVLKDLGSNTCRLTPWTNILPGLTTATVAGIGVAPAPGDTFEVMTLPAIACPVRLQIGSKARCVFVQTRLVSTVFAIETETMYYHACEIALNASGGTVLFNSVQRFFGCSIKGVTSANLLAYGGKIRLFGCGVLDSQMVFAQDSRGDVISSFFQNTSIRIGRASPTVTFQDGSAQASIAIYGTMGAAFFDNVATDGALVVMNGAQVAIDAPLWGTGNTNGTVVKSGSMVTVQTGITPNLSVSGVELSFEGSGTAMPALEASAGAVLPALSPLTTWSQWNAAPFSRRVMNYGTGARIINES